MALLFKHIDKDLEQLKRDVSVIKHILSEEGKLSPHAQKALKEARSTPDSEYISHSELKKRILRSHQSYFLRPKKNTNVQSL